MKKNSSDSQIEEAGQRLRASLVEFESIIEDSTEDEIQKELRRKVFEELKKLIKEIS